MTKKPIPFNFVLDYLYPLPIDLKPMFGTTAIYLHGKILLALRDKPTHTESNGIWIATSKEHHASLLNELPSITSIPVLGGDTGWQLLASSQDEFEELAIRICELIKSNDPRVGKIPKPRKSRK